MARIPELVMAPAGMEWGRWVERKLLEQEATIARLSQDLTIANKALEALRAQVAAI